MNKNIYTNPGFIYIILALLMCSIYYGVEKANGHLEKTSKSILCSWSITSLIILAIILAIKKEQTENKASTKLIVFMYTILIGSLLSSSLIIYLAA